MSAIAAVAEFPHFIENQLFMTREISEDGKYDIQLYDPSKQDFVIVSVSDQIPCRPHKWYDPLRPLFAQPKVSLFLTKKLTPFKTNWKEKRF